MSANEPRPHVDPPDESSSRHLADLSILLVHGGLPAQERTARVLETVAGEVHVARDGPSGLEMFRAVSPDVVVVDLDAPGPDVPDLVAAVRALAPDTPVVAAVAVDEPRQVAWAVDQGVDFLLSRPVEPQALLSALDRAAGMVALRCRVREAEQGLRLLMDAFPGFLALGRGQDTVYANAGLMNHLGFADFEAFQASGLGLVDCLAEVDGKPLLDNPGQWPARMADHPLDRERVVRLGNPRDLPDRGRAFVASCRPFPFPGRCLVSFSEVTGPEDEERHLADRAATDPLTGAVNRRRFMDQLLDEERKAMQGEPGFALVLFDIDHFRSVNNQWGRDVGDNLLKELARLAQDSIRAADVLARWGGEKFMVLAVRSDLNRARRVAERLRRNIEGQDFTGVPRSVTGSFGVAAHVPGESAEALVRRVDEALYRAKSGGRNRVVIG